MPHRDFIHVWPFEVDREELTGKVEEENPTIESAGPILIDDATDMMRASVRGNGLDEKAVFFNSFQGTVLHFETYQVFRITPITGEKYLPGKQQGVVVGSRQDARNKVMATVENAATNIDVHKTTIKFLKLRNDLGFAVEGWAIRFDGMKRNYVVHERCTTCSGVGKGNCPECKGKKTRTCRVCAGTKLMPCSFCKGKKRIQVPNKKKGKPAVMIKCKKCRGAGKERCTSCQGTGGGKCPTCQASGKISCKPCTGTGWRSHITFMEITAKCTFDYDKSKLPHEIPPLIDKLKARLLLEKHAHITINEDLERKKELDNLNKPKEYMMRRPDEFAITYDVRLPWGDIGFNWEPRSEPVTGKLFGFQPALVFMQPFLEEIALPGMRAMNEAAVTRGNNVVGKLHESLRFRIMNDLLLSAARFVPARAIDTVMNRYPFGIRDETVKNLVENANEALKSVTQTSRVTALLAGMAATAALDGAWFIGPLRNMVINSMDSIEQRRMVTSAIDLSLIVVGGMMTVWFIKFFGRKALVKAVGRFLPPAVNKDGKKNKDAKPAARAGATGMLAYLGSAVIMGGAVAAAMLQFGMEPPAWLEFAKHAAGLQ